MPTIPCKIAVNECPPCADNTPFANLSAEAPDFDRFFSVFSFEDSPPLGDLFGQTGCKVVCYSRTSQAEADLCALRSAQLCTWPTYNTPSGGTVPIFSNAAQSCPATCPDGTSQTYTVAAGKILGRSQAEANALALAYACRMAQERLICLSALLSTRGCVGAFYDETIIATGDAMAAVNHWIVSAGALPPGLNLLGGDIAGAVVTIDGIATTAGTYTFTVQVQTPDGDIGSRTYTITIGEISSPASLPAGSVGTAYNVQLLTTGTTPPLTWALTLGSLPAGVTLDPATGILSGTPTTVGLSTFTITETDSSP